MRALRVPFLPVTLDVEPNNSCNFECPHCQVTHWSKPLANLDETSFLRLLRQLPHLARVKLQGMGEPLLNKNLLGMLQIGEEHGISMRFTTNGSVYTEALAARLLDLKDTVITFSVDGATEEVFEQIRVGGKFQKVISNITRLCVPGGDRRNPRIDLWTVVTSKNLHQLCDLVRLSKSVGADGITFQVFVSDWGKQSMATTTHSVRLDPRSQALHQALEEATRLAQDEKVDLRIFGNNLLSKKKPCPWPWTSAYVAANGDVVPCCILADSDTVKMGNVFEQDFAAIWNSSVYRDFRRRIRSHDLPEYCRNCYVDAPPRPAQDQQLKILQ
jgi:radical SAM protein with 4Fe4S-binding SPASM domain